MTTRSLLIRSSSAPRYPLRSASLKQPAMQYSRRSKEDIPHVVVPCGMIVAPTTSDDVRSGPNDRHVTASHGVTARHGKSRCHSTSRHTASHGATARHGKARCHGLSEQSRAEQNPLTPTWDAPALKRPFLGIRSASIHGGSSLLWISASPTSGEWPRMVDHWSLGISLVLRPTGRTSRDAALRPAGRSTRQGKSGRAVAFACERGARQPGARNACGTSRRLCKV